MYIHIRLFQDFYSITGNTIYLLLLMYDFGASYFPCVLVNRVCLCVRLSTVRSMQRLTHRPKACGTSSAKLTSSSEPPYSKHQGSGKTLRESPRCLQRRTQADHLRSSQTGKNWRRRWGRTVHSWETVSAGNTHTHIYIYIVNTHTFRLNSTHPIKGLNITTVQNELLI